MKCGLIGKGYWGSILKFKIESFYNLSFHKGSDIIYTNIPNDMDWIFICTPTNTHYDVVKSSLLHTKNIFCEKPFTGNYELAQSLLKLAHEKNINIFIDNTFLYRNEIKLLTPNCKIIKFVWNKSENIVDNIFNSLLYHDLYLLINLTGMTDWKIEFCKFDKFTLNLIIKNSLFKVHFEYNRSMNYKEKFIFIDDKKIDFSTPKNDALTDLLLDIKYDKLNFLNNNELTLKTLLLLNNIQNNIKE
jgi:hypothetical protein